MSPSFILSSRRLSQTRQLTHILSVSTDPHDEPEKPHPINSRHYSLACRAASHLQVLPGLSCQSEFLTTQFYKTFSPGRSDQGPKWSYQPQPKFVPFGANLNHFGTKSAILVGASQYITFYYFLVLSFKQRFLFFQIQLI